MEIKNSYGSMTFTQWDSDQTITLSEDLSHVRHVHFQDTEGEVAMVVEVHDRIASVPNILLTRNRPFRVWLYADSENRTVFSRNFMVEGKQRPDDYAYTETEVMTWEKLEQYIKDAADKLAGVGSIEQTVVSPDDGGTNIVTFVMTDGRTYAIEVRNGRRGSTGKTGPVGPMGPEGPQGKTGDAGPEGPRGGTGERGPMGPEGPQGKEGRQGPRGAEGYTPVRGTDYWTAEDVSTMDAESKAYIDRQIGPLGAVLDRINGEVI